MLEELYTLLTEILSARSGRDQRHADSTLTRTSICPLNQPPFLYAFSLFVTSIQAEIVSLMRKQNRTHDWHAHNDSSHAQSPCFAQGHESRR